MKTHGIAPIDLLVVNLYPFEATVDKGAGYEDCIETSISAAGDDPRGSQEPRRCRRRGRSFPITRPCSTNRRNKGATTLTHRRRLAAKAYARTAAYDAAISNWFAVQLKNDAPDYRAFGGA